MAKVNSLDGSGVRVVNLTGRSKNNNSDAIDANKSFMQQVKEEQKARENARNRQAQQQAETNDQRAIATTNVSQGAMDDDNTSERIRTVTADAFSVTKGSNGESRVDISIPNVDFVRTARHASNLFDRDELDPFSQRFRFGWINPYDTVSTVREYLFFTKPDLNIMNINGELSPYLRTKSYWTELSVMHPEVIKQLELSLDRNNVFNNLLGNTVISNLDVPASEAEMIDTPANMYGVSYTYRGSSEASDNNPTFSLEFRDTKYLPVFHFFKAYEDYETIKHHGHLPPLEKYKKDRSLYDQYSIYKFLVAEDNETILYYGKYFGVKSKNLPRDVFSNTDFSNGLSYSIEFGAAFYDDMKPYLLAEFNDFYKEQWFNSKFELNVHNTSLDVPDTRPAKAARIFRVRNLHAPGGYVYKLKWKGDSLI